ncbi:CHAT domain-containing protein [Streptomyces europaeiscabiei]|uniref:CHAT domain-containing protein n=1 Tax=Streptomyces europaeiscabiei TaxID=146819 RepID=UPI002E27BB65|nr:CHAT domain-containing protein [Streptomyces europaeiscabiei]
MNRPQSADNLERHLTQEPPVQEDAGTWCDELLHLIMQMPGEMHELALTAASRLDARAVQERDTAAAAMFVAYFAAERDRTVLLRTTDTLIRVGDPLTALFAFHKLRARTRTFGLVFHAEALAVGALAALDRIDGFCPPPLGLYLGTDEGNRTDGPGDAALSELWAALVSRDSDRVAELIAGHGAPHADDPLLAPLYALCDDLLRTPQAYAPVDVPKMRGRLLRGLAYAVPKLGCDRFRLYTRYADAAGISDAQRMVLYERWGQALTMTGRLPEALAMLAEPQETATGLAAAQILRGTARIWRVAGDYDAALDLNDRAMAAVAGTDASATVLGNLWLNRAYTLLGMNRNADAFAAVQMAERWYGKNPFAIIGMAEARGLRCACDPDPAAGVAVAREILALDDQNVLPGQIRGTAVLQAGKALAAEDPVKAVDAFERVMAPKPGNRAVRDEILSGLAAARLVWAHQDGGRLAGADGLALARRTHATALEQNNRLLSARSGLMLSRWLAAADHTERDMPRVALAALDDLGSALAGLTVDAGRRILEELRDDLQVAFDSAVRLNDGHLALRIAETGRALRLMALLRIRPQEMPDDIRRAVAALSAAERAVEGDLPDNEVQTEPGVRAAAAARAVVHADEIEQQAGRIFRNLVAEPPLDITRARALFPRVELLCLSEHLDTVRWVWWPPDEEVPRAGVITLAPRVLRLLDAYAGGTVSAVPGDTVMGLETILPAPLREKLLADPGAADLLIVPGGRIWRVPLAALPLGEERRELCSVARLTVSASLSMATLVAEQALTAWNAGPTRAAGYFNDNLPGAKDEATELEEYEAFVAWQGLDAAREALSSPGAFEFGVLSTHGRPGQGLAQAVEDHMTRRLTAGEALLLTFPHVTALPVCFGMDAAHLEEPIGLVTVAQARGAVWVVGGYQQLRDRTTGWVLSRTYRRMRQGAHLIDALRASQDEYLAALREPSRADVDLTSILASMGELAARQPGCWALTVVGPPHPDCWSTGGEESGR